MVEMTKKRFARIVAAYGADPARWPGEERAAGEAYARTREGERLLAGEAGLERALAALPEPQPAGEALYERLFAVADTPQRPRPMEWLNGWLAALESAFTPRALAGEAAMLATALAAGLWLAASNGAANAEAVDLSPYVLGGEIDLVDEDTR